MGCYENVQLLKISDLITSERFSASRILVSFQLNIIAVQHTHTHKMFA